MTRRFDVPLSGAASLVLVGLVGWGGWLARTDGESRPAVAAVRADILRYVGSDSCAAAGCHNGGDPDHVVGSEYTIWSSRDPHARAFAVLQGPRSQALVARWGGAKAAAEEPRCLACHAAPVGGGLAADGISCEGCHGAAGQWLDAHYTADWRARTPEEKEKQGFLPTKNLAYRVGRCVDCHAGRPGAEVDHDLIAAGHPRLTFEYMAYHELLPRHWIEKTYGLDFAARAWEIGQVVLAGSAAERLAVPSGRSQPEFADYDCFACHHDLQAPSWRQEQGYDGRRPGLPAWGTWSLSMTAALARDGGLDPAVAVRPEAVDGLTRIMLLARPPSGEVGDRAAAASTELTRWAAALQNVAPLDAAGYNPLDKDRVRAFLLGLAAAHSGEDGSANWDEAAQTYLAVAALYQTLARLDPGCPTPARTAIKHLRDALRFPGGPPAGCLDSPRDFAPARFREALKELAGALRD